MTAFEAAMDQLREAHEMIGRLHRQQAAAFLERGLTPSELEDMLDAVDLQEEVLKAIREKLWEMVA